MKCFSMVSKEDLYRLKRCDHAMIRWICGVKIMQPHSTDSLRSKLQIPCIEDVMRWNRLRLYGHRCRQDDDSLWTKKIMNFHVEGPTPRGRPKLRWSDVIKILTFGGIPSSLALHNRRSSNPLQVDDGVETTSK